MSAYERDGCGPYVEREMGAVERAANRLQARLSWPQAEACARDLADLLITDEIQSVLDAGATRAKAAAALHVYNQAPDRSKHLTLRWTDLMADYDEADRALIAAIDVHLASRLS